MSVKRTDIKELLIEDIELKKSFDVNWVTYCDLCGKELNEGDEFTFMGDKKKICADCTGEIIEVINSI